MQTLIQDSARRRPDGSIDIEHYVAVARRARAEEARALRSSVRSGLRSLMLRRLPGPAMLLKLVERPLGASRRA